MFTIFFRSIILYLFIILGVRLLGKRQVGELEPSELVLSFLIADLASVPMQDLGFPLHTGLIPILTLLALSSILSVITLKNVTFRNILCGKPSVIISDGKIDQKEMRRNRLTVDELLEELRCQGYIDLSSIQYAILESNGMLSVLPFPENQPLTLGQMEKFSQSKISFESLGLPKVLVSDGVLLKENLRASGLDLQWLHQKMKEKKCEDVSKIFLLVANEDGSFYLAKQQEVTKND
ncbi:MAG: DUF421 domain-containing protein [Eubacteriales bacterium]